MTKNKDDLPEEMNTVSGAPEWGSWTLADSTTMEELLSELIVVG